MKRVAKKLGIVLTMVCMLMLMAQPVHAKARMSKKKITLAVGQTYKLKVKGIKGKTKWKSSNKSVVTVKKGVITANRKGSAKITAKVKGKKLTCKVTVKENVFYGKDLSNCVRYRIDDVNVEVKVTKMQFISKDRLDVTLRYYPRNGSLVLGNTYLTLFDKNGKAFFDDCVFFVDRINVNCGMGHRHTVHLYRKTFPRMRVIDLTTLNEKNFKYAIGL